MTSKFLISAAAALLAAGAAAQAQAAAAQPAAPAAAAPAAPAAAPAPQALPAPTGAPVPGVCVFSAERTIADSAVGKAFQARMQQLAQQVQAELQPERTQLQTEATTLQGQQQSTPPDQFQQRATALNQRIQAYQAKEEQRSQELDATQQRNLGRIAAEIQPLLASVYNNRKCAVVLNAEAVIAINPAMDISGDVTTALNGRMSTITFDRERLQAPPAGGAAPAR